MRYSKVILAIVLMLALVFGSSMSVYAWGGPDKHDLELTTDGNGSVDGGGRYTKYDNPTISATPNPGYKFIKWTKEVHGPDPTISTETPYVFDMPDNDVTLKAHFEIESYTLTIEVNDESMGSYLANNEGSVLYMTGIEIDALPASGYRVQSWTVNGGSPMSPSDSYDFNMPANDVCVLITFEEIPSFEVTAIVEDEDEWGDVSGTGFYQVGNSVTLTASPSEHFYLSSWDIPDGLPADGSGNEMTFIMPEEDVEIIANFEEDFFVMATIQYLNASDVEIQPEAQAKLYVGDYTFAHPTISGYTFGVSTSNASGTITEESEDFVVIHKYYVPEVITNTVTNTVTETVFVNVPTTTAPTTEATTEAITEEAIPLAAPAIVNFDEIVEDETLAAVEEEIVVEEVPLADALPQTGQLPVDYFYGLGGLISGLGLWLKRRK